MVRYRVIFLLSYMTLLCLQCECENVDNYPWISLIKELKTAMSDCKISRNFTRIPDCIRIFWFKKFDGILSSDEIPLMNGVKLVRHHKNIARESRNKTITYLTKAMENTTDSLPTWSHLILERLSESLSARVLQINISEWTSGETVTTARHRRHRNNMMVAMVFGVTALGSIMVPLGFQFLAVLSGKALLLAKMALLLASINGLKKIASSGVHYGLYQVPEHLNHGYFDRGDILHPRSSS